MKKILKCFVIVGGLLFIGLPENSFAQITVTAGDAPSAPGIYFEMSGKDTVTIPPLGEPGANRYWDFSNVPLAYKSHWRVVDYTTSPFKNYFPDANLVYQVTYDNNDTITYNYVRLTDQNLTELGRGAIVQSGNQTIVTELTVGKRVKARLNFPATYSEPIVPWSSVIVVDTVLSGFKATIIDSSNNQIDAWGKIKTALGELECLRVRQDHFVTAKIFLGVIPLLIPYERNINYYWITNQNNYGILATVTGMSDLLNPPSPNYTQAKSIDIMTNFLTSVADVASETIPSDFELFQNYPNPFNASTIVTYQISQPAEVTVKAFNLAGQEVALLANERQQPGRYQIEWNAGNLPSGVYFYQIQTDKISLKKKCLLLK
ncbi:MAG: T9SS type A sorting domain-containing protein [bacterium]|jgi:hypothetical protein|nr:T9SS type A sorting domain-containing protein [bacterium]